MTILQTRNEIIEQLTSAGIEDADSEARIILRETAGLSATDIHGRPDDEITSDIYNGIQTIIKRRLMREPLQYIYGRWDFMGLSFAVRPGVLIPRPDTEIMVETVMGRLHDGMRILDLCTGTGCILISLLKYSNGCEGVGVDISAEALTLAQENAENINNSASISFLQGDLYGTLTEMVTLITFDIIVSNPPYIPADVIDTLEPEVKKYEPRLALDGGDDGLDIIRRIIDGAPEHLIKGGELFLEIGYDQGPSVSALMREAGFADVEVIPDYAGLDRVVAGRLPIL